MSNALSKFSALKQSAALLFDDYKQSTTAFITNTGATIPWIAFGLTNQPLFAGLAVGLHIVPPILYNTLFGPFGISINYTPTKQSEDGREPDKASERKNEALLTNGEGVIFVNVDISDRLDGFNIGFSAPAEVEIELRDIPRREHAYHREERRLECQKMSQNQFTMVLQIWVSEPATRRREYPLEFIDENSKKKIKEITIIDN